MLSVTLLLFHKTPLTLLHHHLLFLPKLPLLYHLILYHLLSANSLPQHPRLLSRVTLSRLRPTSSRSSPGILVSVGQRTDVWATHSKSVYSVSLTAGTPRRHFPLSEARHLTVPRSTSTPSGALIVARYVRSSAEISRVSTRSATRKTRKARTSTRHGTVRCLVSRRASRHTCTQVPRRPRPPCS